MKLILPPATRAVALLFAGVLASSPVWAEKGGHGGGGGDKGVQSQVQGPRIERTEVQRQEHRSVAVAPRVTNSTGRFSGEHRTYANNDANRFGNRDTNRYSNRYPNRYVNHSYDGRFRSGNCPPGLAKKHNGCMPPGQAKKMSWNRPGAGWGHHAATCATGYPTHGLPLCSRRH